MKLNSTLAANIKMHLAFLILITLCNQNAFV